MNKIKLLLIGLYLLLPGTASALELSHEGKYRIIQAQQYLNDITTMTSKFVQISPYQKNNRANTVMSYGKMFLSRPGKARWEYEIPSPMLIVIKDGRLAYHDIELDQVSYTSVDGELFSFLTEENVDFFSGDLEIASMFTDDHGFRFILQKPVEKTEGDDKARTEQLSLTFLEHPLRFKSFQYKDQNGMVTTVEFKDPEYGMDIDDEQFIFKNPRAFKDAWDKKRN